MNKNNNKTALTKRKANQVAKTPKRCKTSEDRPVASQPLPGSSQGRKNNNLLCGILTRSKTDRLLENDKYNNQENCKQMLDPPINLLTLETRDDIVDCPPGNEDEDQDFESYDRIRTTVDPTEEEFLDEDVQETSDQEDGEIDGESDNEGLDEFANNETISNPDSEVTFRRKTPKKKEIQDFSVFEGNMAFESYIKKMVAKEMAAAAANGKDNAVRNERTSKVTKPTTPVKRGNFALSGDVNKSPSDTTIYAPALQRITNEVDKTKAIVDKILNDQSTDCGTMAIGGGDVSDKITHFIEGVRLEAKSKEPATSVGRSPNAMGPKPGCSTDVSTLVKEIVDPYQEQLDAAKQKANQLILNAEKFKASVNVPPGGFSHSSAFEHNDMVSDDDFFHITCHLDPLIKTKIEKGEYIDLERLLPKSRNTFGGEDTKMSLVHRDGQVFFVPAANGQKINSVRKWEQAFRVYAAVYSQANPSRAAEIWQYVHTINVAASGYMWENVSHYDVTFRHLMSQNPSRSWSKIYNQMWSMTMRDVLPRNNQNFGFGNSFQSNSNGRKSGGGNGNGNQTRKPRYCWGHNRGNCKDGAEKCKYVHRCSYCDNSDHIKENCVQAQQNKKK